MQVALSTVRGKPTGAAMAARATILSGEDAALARRALARKHRILHGVVVPLLHRLRRDRTVHLELTILEQAEHLGAAGY